MKAEVWERDPEKLKTQNEEVQGNLEAVSLKNNFHLHSIVQFIMCFYTHLIKPCNNPRKARSADIIIPIR